MTVCLHEDVSAVQYRVSDLVHGAIALAGGPETTPDWTLVDAESALVEEGATEWTALHMPIPDYSILDDDTLAHAVAAAREVPHYETFALRAWRREWEAILGEATGWKVFGGSLRIVERSLLAHSRRWISGRLEGSGYGLPEIGPGIILLHSERPARENDLAWLRWLTTAETRPAKRSAKSSTASRMPPDCGVRGPANPGRGSSPGRRTGPGCRRIPADLSYHQAHAVEARCADDGRSCGCRPVAGTGWNEPTSGEPAHEEVRPHGPRGGRDLAVQG